MTDFSNIEPPRKTLGKLGAVIFVIVFIGVIVIGAMITMTMFSTFGATVSSFKTAQEEALTTPGAVVLENGIYHYNTPDHSELVLSCTQERTSSTTITICETAGDIPVTFSYKYYNFGKDKRIINETLTINGERQTISCGHISISSGVIQKMVCAPY